MGLPALTGRKWSEKGEENREPDRKEVTPVNLSQEEEEEEEEEEERRRRRKSRKRDGEKIKVRGGEESPHQE
jgi:phosphoenolpyruvate-protein kinase (PTS system EI component)